MPVTQERGWWSPYIIDSNQHTKIYRSAKGLSQPIYVAQNYMKIIMNVEVEVEGTSISLILAEVKHLYIPSRQDESIEWPIRIQDLLHIFHGHCPRYNNCIYGFIGTHVCNKKKNSCLTLLWLLMFSVSHKWQRLI